jgi:hypothetical protein
MKTISQDVPQETFLSEMNERGSIRLLRVRRRNSFTHRYI